MSFGSVRSLVGISFRSFAPITEKDFRLTSRLDFFNIKVVGNWRSREHAHLQERPQVTMVGNRSSNKSLITCGVPQGLVLGPLLFLLYVNDIYCSSTKLKFYLFADDTNVLHSHKDLKSLEKEMNAELNNVYQWLVSNKLTLNLKKTNFVIFRPYQKPLPFLPTIYINNHLTNSLTYLESKDHVKYLGVHIDYKLSWKNHWYWLYNNET